MKNFSFRDVFYGIVLIACVVLYSFLTRFDVVLYDNLAIKIDHFTGKTWYSGMGIEFKPSRVEDPNN